MQALANQALEAASQIFDDVDGTARYVETTPTGEHVFSVARRRRPTLATVTLNPNGISACVEWRGREDRGYRVFRLQGSVKEPSTEVEESA